MPSDQTTQNFTLAMRNLSQPERVAVIRTCDDNTYHGLCGYIKSLVMQNDKKFAVEPRSAAALKQALSPHEPAIRSIIRQHNKATKLKKKMRKKSMRGGGLITLLIAAVAPLIIEALVKSATKKK